MVIGLYSNQKLAQEIDLILMPFFNLTCRIKIAKCSQHFWEEGTLL